MKVIIACSFGVTDETEIGAAVVASGFTVSMLISSGSRRGDELGENWARRRGINVEIVHADWAHAEDVFAAGNERNQAMVDMADALIAVSDGMTRGVNDLLRRARKRKIPVYEWRTDHGL